MQGVGYRAADSLVAVLGGPRSSTPEFINWIYGLQTADTRRPTCCYAEKED